MTLVSISPFGECRFTANIGFDGALLTKIKKEDEENIYTFEYETDGLNRMGLPFTVVDSMFAVRLTENDAYITAILFAKKETLPKYVADSISDDTIEFNVFFKEKEKSLFLLALLKALFKE
jgi:hypothetical protein